MTAVIALTVWALGIWGLTRQQEKIAAANENSDPAFDVIITCLILLWPVMFCFWALSRVGHVVGCLFDRR